MTFIEFYENAVNILSHPVLVYYMLFSVAFNVGSAMFAAHRGNRKLFDKSILQAIILLAVLKMIGEL